MTPPRYRLGMACLAALISLLSTLPAQATPLSLEEALQLAERNAPILQARQEQMTAARHAVIPAGELPDPRLNLGVQNLPVDGSDRWSMNRDFMTMQVVGLSQEVPNRDKREARVETARASVERADAEAVFERLKCVLPQPKLGSRRTPFNGNCSSLRTSTKKTVCWPQQSAHAWPAVPARRPTHLLLTRKLRNSMSKKMFCSHRPLRHGLHSSDGLERMLIRKLKHFRAGQ